MPSKEKRTGREKKRGENVMSVLREYKVRSVFQQQKAVKATCKGRWSSHL